MIAAAQVRAAWALAGIDQKTRAERAGVLLPTIRDARAQLAGKSLRVLIG